jgi:hypothetical protein
MTQDLERRAAGSQDALTLCLINPALLPEWFWSSVAQKVEEETDYRVVIPKMPRSDVSATAEDCVDAIEESLENAPVQYLGALSRGIEYAVRYIDRLEHRDSLQKVLGWTVISSVGPRGYEVISPWTGQPFEERHNPEYTSGLRIDAEGREVLTPQAERLMFRGLPNRSLFERVSADSIPQPPLRDEEVASVPDIPENAPPLAWYIGVYDGVDDHALSAAVAWQKFGVLAQYRNWGHIGPLSHPQEVAATLIQDIENARRQKQVQND